MLPVQYPSTVGGSDLYNALDWVGWNQRNQQFKEAQQNNQINRDTSLQEALFKAQEQPQKLRQLTLGNDTTEAQLPGVKARSALSEDEVNQLLALEQQYPGLRTSAAGSKLNTAMADDKVKQEVAAITMGMVDPSAPVRQAATSQYMNLPETLRYSMGLNSKENIAEGNRQSAERIAEMRAGQKKQIMSIREQIMSGRLSLEKGAALFAGMAMFEQDPQVKAQLENAARWYEEAAQKQKQAAGQAKPTVDVHGLSKGEIPTVGGTIPGATPLPQAGKTTQPSMTPQQEQETIKKKLIGAGKAYEPDKYQYRIDPETGKIQWKDK